MEDLKDKTNILRVLKDKHITLLIKINEQRLGRVIAAEERKAQPEEILGQQKEKNPIH